MKWKVQSRKMVTNTRKKTPRSLHALAPAQAARRAVLQREVKNKDARMKFRNKVGSVAGRREPGASRISAPPKHEGNERGQKQIKMTRAENGRGPPPLRWRGLYTWHPTPAEAEQ
jgi:hypothetical protein